MPLLIFNEKNIIKLLNKNYHFPFTDCFYVGEPDNIFVKKFLKEASGSWFFRSRCFFVSSR
jgi:hypothetical protein